MKTAAARLAASWDWRLLPASRVALGEFGGCGAGWEGGREAEANKRKIFPEDYTDIFVGFIGFGTLRLG